MANRSVMSRLLALVVGATVLAPLAAVAASPSGPDPSATPSGATCAALRPHRWAPATGATDDRGDLRVVGIQFRQDVRYVTSYSSFRTKMRCLVQQYVVPHERPGRPTLVVFNEDIGLMTLAVGGRGAVVRQQAQSPLRAPLTDAGPAPVGAAQALATMNTAYAPQIAAYQAMFGPIDPRKQVFVGATDTFVRAFATTFSDIARDYGIYVVASNNMAPYRETHDPAEVALFGDPDLQPGLTTAYVATSQRVTNSTFLWGPHDAHPGAPDGERNLLFRNEKVPLTDIEKSLLDLDEGPASGPAALANAGGYVVAHHRLGFATSLPAFAWGYPFGDRPAGFEPCADLRTSYMPCMDALGVDTVIQAEANPGRWAGNGGGGYWQPLEWMGSTWRTVADPTVRFRYNVTPMMVGNLLDLAFDGQSAITMRGLSGPARQYVGDSLPDPADGDPTAAGVYAGGKQEFLALAPWVTPDASRADLRATGARLAPGSGDPIEDDYLETAVYADLLPAGA
jgi:hypothetical protein